MDETKKKHIISLLKTKKLGWKDGSEANIKDIRYISNYFSLLKRSHRSSKSADSCLGCIGLLLLLLSVVDVISSIQASQPIAASVGLGAFVLFCLCSCAISKDNYEIEFILVNFETGSIRTWTGKKKRMGNVKLLWKILATNNRGFTNEEVLTRVISSTSQCIAFLEQNLWNTEQLVKKLQEQ